MKSHSPSLSLLFPIAASVVAFFTLCPTQSLAANAAEPLPVVTFSAQQNSGKYTADNNKPSAATGSSTKSSGSKTSASSKTNTVTASTWVDFTVKNLGESNITGLTVNYIVYVKSISTTKTSSSYSMSAINGTETIDLNAAAKTIVRTDPVDKTISTTNTSSSSKGVKSSSASTSETQIAGWYIELVYKGTILKKGASSDTIQADYAKYGPS
jgi:hypothetical protein